MAGIIATVSAIALPQAMAGLHRSRAMAAARYLAAQMALARSRAVTRSAAVALRFDAVNGDYTLSTFVDGNGNGVRSADIRTGADPPLDPPARLSDLFPRVAIALDNDPAGADAVQIGPTPLMSFTPVGTSTPGSIYIRGEDGTQLVVRVTGATARARVLKRIEPNRWVDLY